MMWSPSLAASKITARSYRAPPPTRGLPSRAGRVPLERGGDLLGGGLAAERAGRLDPGLAVAVLAGGAQRRRSARSARPSPRPPRRRPRRRPGRGRGRRGSRRAAPARSPRPARRAAAGRSGRGRPRRSSRARARSARGRAREKTAVGSRSGSGRSAAAQSGLSASRAGLRSPRRRIHARQSRDSAGTARSPHPRLTPVQEPGTVTFFLLLPADPVQAEHARGAPGGRRLHAPRRPAARQRGGRGLVAGSRSGSSRDEEFDDAVARVREIAAAAGGHPRHDRDALARAPLPRRRPRAARSARLGERRDGRDRRVDLRRRRGRARGTGTRTGSGRRRSRSRAGGGRARRSARCRAAASASRRHRPSAEEQRQHRADPLHAAEGRRAPPRAARRGARARRRPPGRAAAAAPRARPRSRAGSRRACPPGRRRRRARGAT